MKIKIDNHQAKVLFNAIFDLGWEGGFEFEVRKKTTILHLFDEEQILDLREICSDYLLQVGFDDDYNVNNQGKLLEELIDIFYLD